MKSRTLAIFLSLFLISPLLSQEKAKIQVKEIKDVEKIDFINRSRKRADISIRRQNEAVGKALAEAITEDGQSSHTYNNFTMQRIFPGEDKKMGADILSMGKSIPYGHVNSLIRIIEAYIRYAFSYSESDAETIAKYIIYYNALHRGDKDYYSEKYTSSVMKNLDSKRIGIARDYKNWAGRSLIVIPLENNILSKSGKDITLDELEKEVNKIIENRKGKDDERKRFDDLSKKKLEDEKSKLKNRIDDLYKNEESLNKKAEESFDKLEELKKDPAKNKAEIEKEKKKVDELNKNKKKLENEKLALRDKAKDIEKKTGENLDINKREKNTSLKKETKELKKQNQNLKKENKEVKKENTSLKEKNKDLTKENKKVTKENVVLKEEKKGVLKENKDLKKSLEIAKERESNEGKYSKNVIGGKIIFLKIIKYTSEGRYNNEIFLLDPAKDDVVIKSDFHNITSKTFRELGSNIVVVGFEENHKDVYKLVILDKSNLKYQGKSETKVFWQTPLVVDNQTKEIYAIEEEDEHFYLTRFDKDLKKIKRSSVEISPFSELTFYGSKIYITSKVKEGQKPSILIFDKNKLELIKTIKPEIE